MAPIKRNKDAKLDAPKCLVTQFKKTKPCSSGKRTSMSSMSKSLPEKRGRRYSRENYNFHLDKLKNVRSKKPEPKAGENSYHRDPTRNRNNIIHRYISSSLQNPRHDDLQSIYNVVSTALEYGCANNILEKRGNYYCFSEQHAARGPTRLCESCGRIIRMHKMNRGKIERRYGQCVKKNCCCHGYGTEFEPICGPKMPIFCCPKCRAVDRVGK
ncbi:unnamed protein product [Ceutorhynchus assimilis]|uniref:Uncharacterized protein n=1 Tax=Ceutorhynchus assimilis TaxID=467358 RepID=A0A9N9MJ58_9CUCU|nr:unnamed protein product [Ceutorhynchus assimilis]